MTQRVSVVRGGSRKLVTMFLAHLEAELIFYRFGSSEPGRSLPLGASLFRPIERLLCAQDRRLAALQA